MKTNNLSTSYEISFKSPITGAVIMRGTLHEFHKMFPHLFYGDRKEETISHSVVRIYADPDHQYIVGELTVPAILDHLFD